MFFSPAARQAIQQKSIVAAYHEIRAEILVHCMLKVLSQSEAEGTFKATVGIRELDDTTLSIGSRVVIKAKDVAESGQNVYVCRVEDVEVRQGKTVHIIRVLQQQDRTYQRKHNRYDAELDVRRSDNLRFKTANLSQGGLQILCKNMLTSALIDKPTEMFVSINGQEEAFECRPCYIVYSWWDQCHKVGVSFVNVSPHQQDVLKTLLMGLGAPESDWVEAAPVPAATPEGSDPKARKTRIDPETGRILVDNS